MEQFVTEGCTVLKKGQTLLYPTDTIWGVGCDATQPDAVQKIYALKQREDSKALICLVSDLEMLEELVGPLDGELKKIAQSNKPTTVIYPKVQGLASNLMAEDGSVGIRIAQDAFCRKLIQTFGKPIVSTSANISGVESPKQFSDIGKPILEGVDYIVALRRAEIRTSASTIIRMEADGTIKTLRA